MKFVSTFSVLGIAALSTIALAGCAGGTGGSSTSSSSTASASSSACTDLGKQLGSTIKGLELASSQSTSARDYTCVWHDSKQKDPLKQKSLTVAQKASSDGSVDKSFLEKNSAVTLIADKHVDSLDGVVYSVADSAKLPNRVVSIDTPKTNTTVTVRNFGDSGFGDSVATKVADAAVSQ